MFSVWLSSYGNYHYEFCFHLRRVLFEIWRKIAFPSIIRTSTTDIHCFVSELPEIMNFPVFSVDGVDSNIWILLKCLFKLDAKTTKPKQFSSSQWKLTFPTISATNNSDQATMPNPKKIWPPRGPPLLQIDSTAISANAIYTQQSSLWNHSHYFWRTLCVVARDISPLHCHAVHIN